MHSNRKKSIAGSRRRLASAISLAGVLALGSAHSAHADSHTNDHTNGEPEKANNKFEVGGFVGAHLFNDDNELGVDDQNQAESPKNSINLGIRVGYALHPLFNIEAELAVMPTSTRLSETPVTIFGWRAHALIHFTDTKFRPFAVLGAGFLTSSPRDQNDFRTDTDFVVHAGLGAKYEVQNNWGVRGDVRLLLPPSTASEFVTTDWEFLIGLYKTFPSKGKKVEPLAPTDADGDGVSDDVDQCPNQAEDPDGNEDEDGCPELDDDGDGIPDTADACPNQPEDMNGVDDGDGCPENDLDGDGIVGTADQCPSDAEDMDGFQDADGCPDPDNDADGVLDANDQCGDQAETMNNYKDGDGCPDEVPVAVQQFTGTIEGIKFRTGSATIAPSSFRVLNQAAKVLTEHPSIKLEVQGHTDTEGKAEWNLTLSQNRADAVVAYLVRKGVDASRFVGKGFGQNNPIADNATPAGRKQNRRVDFVLLK